MSFEIGSLARDRDTGLVGVVDSLNGNELVLKIYTRQGGEGFIGGTVEHFMLYVGDLHLQERPSEEGTVAELVRTLLIGFPMLFLTEVEVYEQLFFVNGNALDWVNGVLTDGQTARERLAEVWTSQARYRAKAIKQRGSPLPEDSDDIEVVRAVARQHRERMRLALARGEVKPEATSMTADGRKKLYPLCQYATILHVPFDAKPDWVRAARYAIDVVAKKYVRTAQDDRWLALAEMRLQFIEKQDRAGFEAIEKGSCGTCFTDFPGRECPSCARGVA